MAKIGIVPGKPFENSKLGPVAREAFSLVPKIANDKIMLWLKEGIVAGDMKLENGWIFTTKTGLYGTNYIQRALITAIGLGANRPQDAVYPTSEGPVGGFGAGSQIVWNVQATIGINITRNIFAELGYRYMCVDYENDNLLYQMNSFGLFSGIGVKF